MSVAGIWIPAVVSVAVLVWLGAGCRSLARRVLHGAPPDLIALGAMLYASGLLVGTGLLLGAAGVLSAWAWWASLMLAGLALHMAVRRAPVNGRTPAPPEERGPSAVFQLTLAGVVLGRALYTVRNPPSDVDSLAYHLPMIATWIQTRALGVALAEPPVIGTYFPGNAELLQMFAALATGRDTLAAWPALFGLVLLTLALRRIAIDAGARPAVAEAAALAVSLAPGVLRLTSGIRVDVLLGAWFAAALLFALRFRREPRARWLVPLLLGGALVAGTRTTGPVFFAVLLVAAFAGTRARERLRTLWRVRWGAALAALAGGFWHIRNALATGNPIYPAPFALGPFHADGFLDPELLLGTSQLVMWLRGEAGHFNVGTLLAFYGAGLVLIVLGGLAAAWRGAGRGHQPEGARGLAALSCVALACLALFLISPYSGASHPSGPERRVVFSADNVRYVLPALVVFVPVAARGLGRFPGAWVSVALLAAAIVPGLVPLRGHVLPGLLAVVVAGGLWRLRPAGLAAHGRALAIAGVLGAGTAVAVITQRVEPLRARVAGEVVDGYRERLGGFGAATIAEVRGAAAGRPIALVGGATWWNYYGRDFSGHPVYVPVATPWVQASRPFHLRRDPRDRAERALWLSNLEQSGAAFLVLAPPDCGRPPVEADWVAELPDRFLLRHATDCRRVYEVAGPG